MATRRIFMPNAEMEYKSPEDLRREAWYELQSAMKVGTILTGKLVSVEHTNVGTICTTNCKGFRIVIPATEMNVISLARNAANAPKEGITDRILGGMIGCEIDFVIKGMKAATAEESETIVASRKEAMERKMSKYFIEKREDGNPLITPGAEVAARIVAISSGKMTAELFGVICSFNAGDTAYDWIDDMHDYYEVGQLVYGTVEKIDIEGKTVKSVKMDIASTLKETIIASLSELKVGARYSGKVTGFHKGIWYIRLMNGAMVQARECRDLRIPGIGDTVTYVPKIINTDDGYSYGIITSIVARGTK